MKKFFPLIFLFILLFQLTNCKPEGKGKLIMTLETQEVTDAAAQKKITDIIKHRFEAIGIDAEDIAIIPKENRLELTISGTSNYPPDLVNNVRRMLNYNGNIELWETFTLGEISYPLMQALRGNDTDYSSTADNAWKRFTTIMIYNPDMQNNPKTCDLGYAKVKDTALVNSLMDTAYLSKKLPYNLRHVWSQPEIIEGQQFCKLILLKATKEGKARMPNPEITKIEIDDSGELEALTFYLAGFDKGLWAKMTKENNGQNIAIVVDGIAYTWPVVMGEIPGGVFSITGKHETGDYEKLKAILEAGYFPVPVRIVEEKVVN